MALEKRHGQLGRFDGGIWISKSNITLDFIQDVKTTGTSDGSSGFIADILHSDSGETR